MPPPKLCDPDGKYDINAYYLLSKRLSHKVGYLPALCTIDEALVQAQHDCPDDLQGWNYRMIALLMERLAENWARRGVLERADQLYGRAYALFVDVEASFTAHSGRQRVLMGWADLKVKMGDAPSAKELAYLEAGLTRWEHDQGAPSPWDLVRALEFQADIFERIGLADEAQALVKEAEELASNTNICRGYCKDRFRETHGGVREKR
jgi:hypothetical protein